VEKMSIESRSTIALTNGQ